jgi:hypothetical protein
VYNGNTWVLIASRADVIEDSKYSTSKNPSTGLYYRLHIMKVGVSDLKKYQCSGAVDGRVQSFFLQLILIGRCNYILAIFNR